MAVSRWAARALFPAECAEIDAILSSNPAFSDTVQSQLLLMGEAALNHYANVLRAVGDLKDSLSEASLLALVSCKDREKVDTCFVTLSSHDFVVDEAFFTNVVMLDRVAQFCHLVQWLNIHGLLYGQYGNVHAMLGQADVLLSDAVFQRLNRGEIGGARRLGDILNACQQGSTLEERIQSVIGYLDTTLNQPALAQFSGMAQALALTVSHNDYNPDESAHTRSVNITAFRTAKKLMALYGGQVDTAEKLEVLLHQVRASLESALPSREQLMQQSPQLTAADIVRDVRAAAREGIAQVILPVFNAVITDPDDSVPEADREQISFHQFLALTWLVLQDESQLACSVDEAKEVFYQILYKILRGRNLDDSGNDNGKADDIACVAGGAFNTLAEHLVGVYQEAELTYVTAESARMKLDPVAREELQRHLTELSLTDQQIAIRALQQHQGMTTILWQAIKGAVGDRLFEEFHSAPGLEDRHGQVFEDLLAFGLEVNVRPVLAEFEPTAAAVAAPAPADTEESKGGDKSEAAEVVETPAASAVVPPLSVAAAYFMGGRSSGGATSQAEWRQRRGPGSGPTGSGGTDQA